MKKMSQIPKDRSRLAISQCVSYEEPLDRADGDDEDAGEEGGEAVAAPGVAGVGDADLWD